MEYEKCPRYDKHELTEQQIEEIATRAAEKAASMAVEIAEKNFFQAVGKRVMGAAFYVIGVTVVGMFAIALGKGWIKP